jgi:hypothetical protein
VSFPRKISPCAKLTSICGVHLQQANRRSANCTATLNNKNSVAFEVLILPVLPRMKQPDERAAFRIKSTQVSDPCAHLQWVAGQGEVFAVVSSAMLASNDVLDVISEERLRVFAEGSSIPSDDRHVHGRFTGAARPSGGMAFSQESTSFRFPNGIEISDTNH